MEKEGENGDAPEAPSNVVPSADDILQQGRDRCIFGGLGARGSAGNECRSHYACTKIHTQPVCINAHIIRAYWHEACTFIRETIDNPACRMNVQDTIPLTFLYQLLESSERAQKQRV